VNIYQTCRSKKSCGKKIWFNYLQLQKNFGSLYTEVGAGEF